MSSVVLIPTDVSTLTLHTEAGVADQWRAPGLVQADDSESGRASEIDLPGLRRRVDEAAQWAAAHPSVRRRLGFAVIDVAEAECRWVQAPSAAPPVLASTLRSNAEEWSGVAPVGGIQPLVDEQPSRGLLDRLRGGGGEDGPTRGMAVITMPDALVRLWLDALDRRGVPTPRVLSVWHAMALTLGEDDDELRGFVAAQGDDRLVWTWARGRDLLAGGSVSLGPPSPAAADGDDPSRAHDRARSAAQRLSLDWVAWSAQLGVTPGSIAILAGPPGEAITREVSTRWTTAAVRHEPVDNGVDRVLGQLLTMPAGRLDAASPRRCMARLSSRPGRAQRRRLRLAAVALVALGAAAIGLGVRLSDAAEGTSAEAAAIQDATRTRVAERYDEFGPLSNPVRFLSDELAGIRERAAFAAPPEPKPIFPAIEQTLRIVGQYEDARLATIRLKQTESGQVLVIDDIDPREQSQLIPELNESQPFITWSPGSGAGRGERLSLNGLWRDLPTEDAQGDGEGGS